MQHDEIIDIAEAAIGVDEPVVEETPIVFYDMPIVFLAPADLIGKAGIQRTNNMHEVIAVLTDDGVDVSATGCSYKGIDQ